MIPQVVDYDTLQEAVIGMLHREGDTDFANSLPGFVQLCEADLNDALLLRDMETESTLTGTVNQNYVALPAGFVSPIALWLVIDQYRQILDPALPQELPYWTDGTQPKYWAIDGDNIRFDCPLGQAYSIPFRYIKKSNLSDSATTNYLILKRPDVYLYGTLKQAAMFIDDDASLQKFGVLYNAAKAALKAADNRNRSIVPLRTEIPTIKRRGNIYSGGYN